MAVYIYEPEANSVGSTQSSDDGYGSIQGPNRGWVHTANSVNVGRLGGVIYSSGFRWVPVGGVGSGCPQGATVSSAIVRHYVRRGTLVGLLSELDIEESFDNAIDLLAYTVQAGNLPHEISPVTTAVAITVPADPDPVNQSLPWFVDIDMTAHVAPLVANALWHEDATCRSAVLTLAAEGTNHFIAWQGFEVFGGAQEVSRLTITTLDETGDPNMIVEDEADGVVSSGGTAVNLGVTPDGTAITERIEVRNSGDQPLVFASSNAVVLAGTDYSLTETIANDTSIAAGASDFITVQRDAATIGTSAGTITLLTNDPTNPTFIINITSLVLQRYIEVQSPTGVIVNPPNPNLARYSVGSAQVSETLSKQLKIFARQGGAVTDVSTAPYIAPNNYNTVASEWLTKAADALDRRGGNDLENISSVAFTPAFFGQAAIFDTTGSPAKHLRRTSATLVEDVAPTNGVNYVYSCWVNRAAVGTNVAYMAKWGGTAAAQENFLGAQVAGNAPIFRRRANDGGAGAFTTYTATSTGAASSTGVWYHFCGIYEAATNTIHCFMDGANGGSTSCGTDTHMTVGTADFTVGAAASGALPANATVFGARVLLNVDLTNQTPAELAASLYNSGVPLDLDDVFSITENIPTGTSLVQNVEDNLTVQFVPLALQTYDATIVIPSDVIDTPIELNIRGIGVAATGFITVDDETPTDIPNGGTVDLDNPAVGVANNEQLTVTANADAVEIASVRMNDPSGGAQSYDSFPLVAARNRQAFVDLYATQSSAIIREVYSGASDEAWPAQNTGKRKCLHNHYQTWLWNQNKLGVMLPTSPPLRTTARYGDGSQFATAELITGAWTFTAPSTYGNPSGLTNWADYTADNTIIFGFSNIPKTLSTTTWLVMQVCSDGSQMNSGFETWINGYDGTFKGNGADKFIDTSVGLTAHIVVPTIDGASYGSLEWQISWSSDSARDAAKTVFASGTLVEGTDFNARRNIAGVGATEHHIKIDLGTFDFRAEDVNAKYFQVWVRAASTGPGTPCGITTEWTETAAAASRKGRTRIPMCRSGSDFLQMLTDYANGGSLLALLNPDVVEIGGFGNYSRRSPVKTGAQLITDLQNWIDFIRGEVPGVPIIVDGGWNIDDGAGSAGDDTIPTQGTHGDPIPAANQLLLDQFSSIAYAVDRDDVAAFNGRLYLEATGWNTADIPALQSDHDGTTIDGTHPAYEGAQRITEGMYACHEALIMLRFTEEIPDATTILQDATDTFTIENTSVITAAYASYIGPTLTNIVITHDGIDTPHIIEVTGLIGAAAIIQVEDQFQIIPPYSLALDYFVPFGTTTQGTHVDRVLTITNIGELPLQLIVTINTSVITSFVNISEFLPGTVLEPDETATITVRMPATVVGELFGQLVIYHDGVDTNGGTSQFLVLLTGTVEEIEEDESDLLGKRITRVTQSRIRYPR